MSRTDDMVEDARIFADGLAARCDPAARPFLELVPRIVDMGLGGYVDGSGSYLALVQDIDHAVAALRKDRA